MPPIILRVIEIELGVQVLQRGARLQVTGVDPCVIAQVNRQIVPGKKLAVHKVQLPGLRRVLELPGELAFNIVLLPILTQTVQSGLVRLNFLLVLGVEGFLLPRQLESGIFLVHLLVAAGLPLQPEKGVDVLDTLLRIPDSLVTYNHLLFSLTRCKIIVGEIRTYS